MKSKITLLLFSLFSFLGIAQDKTYDLLKDKTQTHILYDRVYNISHADNLKTEEISANYFLQVYHEMQRADFSNRLPKLETIREEVNIGFAQKQIPLSILISDFETIKKSELESKNVFLNAHNQMEVKPNTEAFEQHNITLIAPILGKSKTNQVTFILKDNLIFNTTNQVISSISIQNEGEKSWKTITVNAPFQINFAKAGKQIINCKIEFTSGVTKTISFTLETDNQVYATANKNSNAPLVPNVINTISSTIAYQGYGETQAYVGQGEYEIFMDTTDGVLDKPIFLLDGFDPGDSRNISAIYGLLNYGTSGQNLGDIVRAQGYDLIVLNFPTYTRPSTTTVVDGGVDYIQRNAMILIELINQINAQKSGTAQNVIIGPSMGGLISRYALRYMETHSLNPDTRLYLSFDSPHLGANVPIGYQHLFNYMAFGPVADVTMQTLVNSMLKSPAAREMLIDHFEGHLQSGSPTEFNTATSTLFPTGCPNYRTAFQTELNTLGFPQSTRNIAIANGAGNGTMTGTPNMVAMNHTFDITSTQRAIINLRFTPYANQTNQVSHFQGQQWILVWLTFYESMANSKSPSTTNGLDSAPGGRFDMNSIAASGTGNALFTEFMNNLNIMYFDFIPTLSSMSVTGNNYYSNVNSSSTTPFEAYYIPTTNENHVTLTPENVAFALNEILNPVLSNHDDVALNSIWIKNPMANSIEINSNYSIENATILVTDVLGKTILNTNNQNINGTLEIPVSLSNGVYLITVKNDKGSITKKIVKG